MRKAQYQKQLSVSLPQEIISKIKAITDKDDISMGEWIRKAVERALQTKPTQKKKEGGN